MLERRLTWLAGIFLVWGAAILLNLSWLQVVHHRRYTALAKARQEIVVPIQAPRGTILDRTGRPLAMSVPTESVYVNPLKTDPVVASGILAGVLKMDRTELYAKLLQARDSHRGFLWIKRRVPYEEARHLEEMRLDWIWLQEETQRKYPKGELAAHVLGGVDFEEKGVAGVERALEPDLRGEPGEARLLTDVLRRGIEQQQAQEARIGTPVTLTIDERTQFVAERELAAAVRAQQAVSGSVVVMVPSDGQILALASYPSYDPNKPPRTAAEVAARMNHAVSVPFEPGSVFKVITLSSALETTNLRPESPINCHGGVLKLPGRVVHDSHAGMGVVPMATVLAKSSNVGAIMVGSRVGQEHLHEYVRRFGFGAKTGIQLPSESSGKVRALKNWGTTSWASVSMGQEVSVTTVQLAQAGSVIANGGMLVRPRLVLKKGDKSVPAPAPVRVIQPDTAITMRKMMEGVVLPGGTGTRARLDGYSLGGKTGSAQIFNVKEHRYTHTYNGSFVGFAPLTNPAIVVVVTLNGTHGTGGFGGAAAAPVFRAVASEALRVLDVPKDLPETTPNQPAPKLLDFADLADAGADPGQRNILEEMDEEQRAADAELAAVGPKPEGPRVPDFRGKSMRAVLAQATAAGLVVEPHGTGTSRAQQPPAGSPLRPGDRIRVEFTP